MLLPGDIICVKGTSLISKLIKRATKSEYSHCAIVISTEPCQIVEIDYKYHLKINAIHYTYYDVFRCENISNTQLDTIKNYLMSSLGAQYDFLQLFTQWLNILVKAFPIVNSPIRFLCSEVIDRAYQKAGRDLAPEAVEGNVTPADLSRSKLLFKVKEVDNTI